MNLHLGGQGSVLELSHFCNHETVEQTATRTQIKEPRTQQLVVDEDDTMHLNDHQVAAACTKYRMTQFLPLEIGGSHIARQEASCFLSNEAEKYHQHHSNSCFPLGYVETSRWSKSAHKNKCVRLIPFF